MKLILRYIRPYRWFIAAVMLIKLVGTGTDLLMPYVLEHLLDHVIPAASDAWCSCPRRSRPISPDSSPRRSRTAPR